MVSVHSQCLCYLSMASQREHSADVCLQCQRLDLAMIAKEGGDRSDGDGRQPAELGLGG